MCTVRFTLRHTQLSIARELTTPYRVSVKGGDRIHHEFLHVYMGFPPVRFENLFERRVSRGIPKTFEMESCAVMRDHYQRTTCLRLSRTVFDYCQDREKNSPIEKRENRKRDDRIENFCIARNIFVEYIYIYACRGYNSCSNRNNESSC